MSAGFKYDLTPVVEQEERYDVQTGIRRRGPYKLGHYELGDRKFPPIVRSDSCGLEKQVRLCGD